ncbi:DNA modification methylase [Leucobacter tenebrionis]|uniref:DNA modification methylase n=1 Tax=Leucobacter tenebrionis TaxID=2873270 RepID=UPI001CA64D66|nr:DNA modification methylase [Leucobacter tenebrionis]QZY53008.1 DNA modification methylase [Leucobacter tenebrionis]
MKIRIASSVALAAALALGATGCSLIAPQGTLEPYAPSDGRDVSTEHVDVRNIMLVADETGENFNVVFSAVNRSGSDQQLTINFVGEGSASASAEFDVPEGNTRFGNPEGEQTPVLVALPGVEVGSTVTAYFQVAGTPEVEYEIPVLDGTLAEYRDYVLPADFSDSKADKTDKADEATAADQEADQSHVAENEEGEPQ